jgi:hypothetical protein
MLIKSLLRDAQKSETTRSLEEIISPTSDSSVAMSSPLNSARDILNFSKKALYSIMNLVRLIPNLVTTHKWFINWIVWRQTTLFLESWVNPGSLGHRGRVTLQHTEAYRVIRAQMPGHPTNCLTGRHRSDWCLSPVRPVTSSAHLFGDFTLLVPWMCEYVTNLSPATWKGNALLESH